MKLWLYLSCVCIFFTCGLQTHTHMHVKFCKFRIKIYRWLSLSDMVMNSRLTGISWSVRPSCVTQMFLCPGSTGSLCGSQMSSSTFRPTSTLPEWRSTTTKPLRTSPSTSPWRTRSTEMECFSMTGEKQNDGSGPSVLRQKDSLLTHCDHAAALCCGLSHLPCCGIVVLFVIPPNNTPLPVILILPPLSPTPPGN